VIKMESQICLKVIKINLDLMLIFNIHVIPLNMIGSVFSRSKYKKGGAWPFFSSRVFVYSVFKMPPKSVSQRPTSSAITYAILAAAAVGFLAVFVYRRIYPQPRRRDDDDEVENV
jgi:hypothetical protein